MQKKTFNFPLLIFLTGFCILGCSLSKTSGIVEESKVPVKLEAVFPRKVWKDKLED